MKNYKEILRLNSLGIKNTEIALSCKCSRTTVITTLKRAGELNLNWEKVRDLSNEEVAKKSYHPMQSVLPIKCQIITIYTVKWQRVE